MKSFMVLVTAVSLWIVVTATPQGYVEGTENLDGLLPEEDETEKYDANQLAKKLTSRYKPSDRSVKGKLS